MNEERNTLEQEREFLISRLAPDGLPQDFTYWLARDIRRAVEIERMIHRLTNRLAIVEIMLSELEDANE